MTTSRSTRAKWFSRQVWREECGPVGVAHCELIQNIHALLDATRDFFARYNETPGGVRSILGAHPASSLAMSSETVCKCTFGRASGARTVVDWVSPERGAAMVSMRGAFAFEDDGRFYTCRIEEPHGGRPEAWWWFGVSDDASRHAPCRAAVGDTEASVRARVVAYDGHR